MPKLAMTSDACLDFSNGGNYRYWLSRVWDASLPMLVWVMLNPSTADHEQDDPTIRRCIVFAKLWGYGGIYVVNLFALRATSPSALKRVDDPVGPRNDYHIVLKVTAPGRTIVAAWGTKGRLYGRDKEFKRLMRKQHCRMYCLGTTKDGHPWHPLYVKGATRLRLYSSKEAV